MLFRGFDFWNINVEERGRYSFNFEKWAAVKVPVAVLCSLLLLAHSPSVALLFHSPNTAGTSYLACIQIYNSQSHSLSPSSHTHTHTHKHTQTVDFVATDTVVLSLSNSLPPDPDQPPQRILKMSSNFFLTVGCVWSCHLRRLLFGMSPLTVKCQGIGGNYSV